MPVPWPEERARRAKVRRLGRCEFYFTELSAGVSTTLLISRFGVHFLECTTGKELLAEFLYGVKAHDMLTLVLVSSLLMAVTFIASYVPARHATKIDPMQAVRHE